jgi:FtsX-like permease family
MLDQFTSSPVCGNTVNCTSTPSVMQPSKASQSKPTALLREELMGLPPAQGDKLVAELQSFRGVTTVPIYSEPQNVNPSGPPAVSSANAVVPCAPMKIIAALGECAPEQTYAQANTWNLYGDNPTYTTQPIVSASSQKATGVRGLYLQAVLIKVRSAAALEVVRTFLIAHTPGTISGSAARTFGEAVQARLGVAAIVQRLVDIAVALTLLVAGCSLAVAVGGGLVERKRPFTMLRLAGTPTATLNRVVLLEAVLPLAAATVAAGVAAYGISLLTVKKMGPAGTPIPSLGHVYFETMGAGLVVSLLIIAMTLPLLRRITGTENVRFE